MIKIENGAKKLPNGNYQYDYWTAIGLDEVDDTINRSIFHSVEFTVQPGQTPEIGDFIEGNALVKRVGIQVTEGKMRWPVEYNPDGNGWGSNHTVDKGWQK